MKKLMTLVVCLLLAASAALAEGPLPEELLLPGQDRVTLAEAVGMAFGLMEPQPGTTISRASLVRLTDNTHAWVVTVQERGGEGQRAWTYTFSADDGELLWQEAAAQGDFPQTRQAWVTARGAEGRWTGEQRTLFDRLYAAAGEAALSPEGQVSQEEACEIALAAVGMAEDGDYQLACSLSGDRWQIILVQEGVAMWQVTVDASDGQVTLIAPGGAGNG
ncbi:MAG: hypothetical protein ACI4OY_04995 [Aristaeellaceae bacterium]